MSDYQKPLFPPAPAGGRLQFRQGLAFVAGMAAGILILALVLLWGYAFTAGGSNRQQVHVYVPPGAGVGQIRHLLAGQQLVADDARFELLAVLMGVASRLQAGEYAIQAGATPYAILRQMSRGAVRLRRVTIPEGTTVAGIAAIVAGARLGDADDFVALAADRQYINGLGLEVGSLEGYLFPDTYYFPRGIGIKAIITTMVRRGETVWRELHGDQLAGSLSRHQILTLASIVEKETGVPAERPMVARVFLERLQRDMRLQADPTVIYGLGKYGRPLTRQDLRIDNPYNTYVHHGLPPGPIANPGRAAIESVLHPAAAQYLYFVSRNDGTHQFSTTLKEHNRAVRRYQRQGRQRQK